MRKISVYGTLCEVEVVKSGKTVWQSYGKYRDNFYEAKGRSEASALKNWQWIVERMNDYG